MTEERHWRPSDTHEQEHMAFTQRIQSAVADAFLWALHSPDAPHVPDHEIQALDEAGGPTIDRHHPVKQRAIEIFGKRTYEVFSAWKKHSP